MKRRTLRAVAGEAALRDEVGGSATMQHHKSNMTLQVLPFTVGAHPGVDGAFTVLSMPEQDEQEVILVEAMTSSLYLEAEQQVGRYRFRLQSHQGRLPPALRSRGSVAPRPLRLPALKETDEP